MPRGRLTLGAALGALLFGQISLTPSGKVSEIRVPSREQPHRYRSRIDGLLVLVLFGVPSGLLVAFAGAVLALPGASRVVVLVLLGPFLACCYGRC